MNTKKLIKGIVVFASTAIFSLSTVQSAYAAPGALATAPLFLSTIVEPNVFFTLDDSGSMDWGPMFSSTAGIAATGGLPVVNDPSGDMLERAYYAPEPQFTHLYSNRHTLPPADGTDANWDLGWVVRSHLANRNYYNPSVVYTPWAGTNADGTPMYVDADPTAALQDPNKSGAGDEKIDLTVSYTFTEDTKTSTDLYIPTYFIWNDDNGNGIIEQTAAGDSHTRVKIAAGTAEMQNFANWFQYYRSRINATKKIIGGTINNTDSSRMGMSFINSTIARIDVETMSDTAKKRTLLQALYGLRIPQRGTPLRRALEAVGNYFDDTGANAPILSAADGGECQQNFNILMSDGFWNGSNPSVGNTDKNGGSGGDTIFDGDAAQSNDGGNYTDNFSNTLADVAMHNYETDLRTTLADKVPTQPGIDEASHQHLVTYTIAFGLNGTLDPTTADPLAVGFSWPQPVADTLTAVDDMWHAAYNGRGKFLSAQNPAELAASLDAAISDIAERTATAAAVSINSAKLTTDSVVYLAQFNTNRWQGNLFAFRIIDLNTGALSTTPDWTAADELNARNVVTNPRVMLTHNGTAGAPFQWTNLSAAQQADLKTNPAGGVDADAVGMARVDYMRGDRTNEGSGYFFRTRASLLSDLVNSGPVFVGEPDLNWPDVAPFPDTAGSRYSEYKNGAAKTRDGVIYAGANDGMLHGFAELDGAEVLAYFPNNLFSTAAGEGIHYLTDQNYGHRYYNDLTPSVSDIYADLGSGNKWQTVLISGQRGGGRGIYALDVTDPADFSELNASDLVLWEFTNTTDPDLGYTYSRPQIGLANDGSWVAIFGNGYNDTGDGKAKLFIVKISEGVDGSWALGTDYIKLTTNAGSTINRNGLATPALADLDGNGTIDRVYAGDLQGKMWAFDLSSTSAASWNIPGSAPLFTTIGNLPITAKPTLAKHPTISDTGSNAPNIMVFFGSGQYLVNSDKTSTSLNHFYGVWDKGSGSLNSSDLVEQTYENGFVDALGDPVRVLSRNVVDYAGIDYGWYFELDEPGERSVTNPVVRGGIVFFNSFVPVSDPCSVGGFGFRFAVDMITGGSPDNVVADYNGDGVIDDNDKATDGSGGTDTIAAIRQEGFLPEPVFIEDIAFTAETPSKVVKLKDIPKGRFSWQELIQ